MKFRTALLTASCTVALAACGAENRPADADPPSDETTAPVDTAPAPSPESTTPPPGQNDPSTADGGMAANRSGPDAAAQDRASDATADASSAVVDDAGDTATVTNCSTTIEGNDRMQFNVDSINIPADCGEFTINLEHTGSLPVAAMGHNVVVTTTADYPGAAADGLSAGAAADYVQPDDDRVIAHTDMIGGGESTSVTFSTDSLDSAGDYTFFCSFPGHSALMRGTLSFGG